PAARARRDRAGLPRPLLPPPRRRVPGHQSLAVAADRGAAGSEVPARRGRRRTAVDLLLPPRRSGGVPAPPRADRRRPGRRADAPQPPLPLTPRACLGGHALR